jgi:hypothetical protein
MTDQNNGFRPNGFMQTPTALTHVTHQTGEASQAGLNVAIQHWAGFHLLAAGNERLAASPMVHNSETILALGGNHLATR